MLTSDSERNVSGRPPTLLDAWRVVRVVGPSQPCLARPDDNTSPCEADIFPLARLSLDTATHCTTV